MRCWTRDGLCHGTHFSHGMIEPNPCGIGPVCCPSTRRERDALRAGLMGLGAVEETKQSAVAELFTNALIGALIGAPSGAVVAASGRRVKGAMLGGAVGAGASVVLAMLL